MRIVYKSIVKKPKVAVVPTRSIIAKDITPFDSMAVLIKGPKKVRKTNSV